MKTIRIPEEEYLTRAKRAAQMTAERGLDALFLFGSEGDFQNVRYLQASHPSGNGLVSSSLHRERLRCSLVPRG
ncbi:MAG: hypothetical protein V8S92_08885 [Oscillospiraceae bacterium]